MMKPSVLSIAAIGILLTISSVRAAPGSDPTSTRHLSVTMSTSAGTVAPGERVSLVVDVTPKQDMHVYAPGQTDVIPVSLTLTPGEAAVSRPLQFPKAEKLEIKELGETHLVYSKPFRLVQDVTVAASRSLVKRAAAPGASLTLKGTLRYQACDNTICYAPVNVPVTWTLALQGASSGSVKKQQR